MNFTIFCVAVVIIIITTLITGVTNFIATSDDCMDDWMVAWLISTFGLGISITIILYQNGWLR